MREMGWPERRGGGEEGIFGINTTLGGADVSFGEKGLLWVWGWSGQNGDTGGGGGGGGGGKGAGGGKATARPHRKFPGVGNGRK